MKEAEPIEEVLPVEPDQDVMEEVKEQKQSPITVLSEEDEKYLSDEARFLLQMNLGFVLSKKFTLILKRKQCQERKE